MERYGRTSEGSQSDPSPEWTGTGGETGLEEAVWQFELGGGESYPQRPDEADCIYYLRTGFCGYGSRCRFNHPRDRGAVIGAARTGGEFPERVGQPVCQYYMRTGSCKFGSSCKYHHPRQGGGTFSPVSLNYYGYPLRPGEKECSYYVKTGQCKFGRTCKFHHPQPAGMQIPAQTPVPPVSPLPVPVPSPLYPTVQPSSGPSSSQYGVMVATPRPPLLPGSLVHSPYGQLVLSPAVVPFPGWSPYQLYGMGQLPPSASSYSGQYQPPGSSVGPSGSSQKEQSFPERPGQPECQYYMKTGECKFGPSCRYHHPPELVAPKTNVVLSPVGLPLRPGIYKKNRGSNGDRGAPPCTHYAQRGVCKFGSACKFDHPIGALSYSPSASSLADMPVAPYPVGSSIGTLAPSSSSELRPELISGSGNESASSRISSSMSTSTASVGLTLSSGGSISQSTVQQSAQSSSPSAITNSIASSSISHTSS
ncbi:zinc finger CCCH domain-containing protein 34-like isoform X3 [Prosopis cineraria]|uniref:zinc finger CCCH domain-containing protein 34-like isoform X3 n=1 Tax=Prosopis cineraria TaxID=364024 RepID=UPI00240F22CD|nr:zinc finger CCCH domain-containing protein 34-like isoform X3 [Prosopis cineraria]